MISKEHSELIPVSLLFPTSIRASRHVRKSGKKIVYYAEPSDHSKCIFHTISPPGILARSWARHFYRQGEMIVTSSASCKDILRKCGIEKQIYVVPQGVDTSYYQPDSSARSSLRKKLQVGEEKKIVLLPDDLSDKNRTREYAEMITDLPDILFLWIRPDTGDRIRQSSRSRIYGALKNVRIPHAADADRLKEICQGCDALFTSDADPSEESCILKAMACGLPVVAADASLFDGMLSDRKNVCLVRKGESRSEKLLAVLQSVPAEICRNARKFAQERDYVQIRKIMRQIYDIENLVDDNEQNYFRER